MAEERIRKSNPDKPEELRQEQRELTPEQLAGVSGGVPEHISKAGLEEDKKSTQS